MGIGVALFNEGCGGSATGYRNRSITSISGYDAARVIVLPDGRIEIRSSAAEAGQGHAATCREIAQRLTGLAADQIDVMEGDADRCPSGTGTFASRGAVGIFESVVQAIRAVCELNLAPGTDVTRTVDQPREVAQCAALAIVEVDPLSLIPRVAQRQCHVRHTVRQERWITRRSRSSSTGSRATDCGSSLAGPRWARVTR